MNYTSKPTVPGYYWWLPHCFLRTPQAHQYWSIVIIHPLDPNAEKNGLFYGPLENPSIKFNSLTGHNAYDREADELIKQTIEAI